MHQLNQRNLNECFAGVGIGFVVFAVSARTADPGERSFNHPTLSNHFEAESAFRFVNEFQRITQRRSYEVG